MSNFNYEKAIDYLYTSMPMFQQVGSDAYKPGFERILALCALADNPHTKFKTIHIAGTNGKGSTAHSLSAILQTAGYKTGLFTSPHLKSFTERARINGISVSEAYVTDFVNKYYYDFEVIKPSFFELTTFLAFEYFASQNVDIAVIETGMGGRLDSTNIISPLVSIITNISWDHADYLGDTLPKIAGEKAGIIKQNTPVVISQYQSEDILNVFTEKVKLENAPIYFSWEVFQHGVAEFKNDGYQYLTYLFENKNYTIKSSLLGACQIDNLRGVLSACKVLKSKGVNIDDKHIFTALANVQQLSGLKGRWQILNNKPLTICDTAHNEDGLKQTFAQLQTLNYNNLFIVLGMAKDKYPEKLLHLFPKQANYIICEAKISRAAKAEELFQVFKNHGFNVQLEPDVNKAIAFAQSLAKNEDVIYIGGSTFVVAEIDGL